MIEDIINKQLVEIYFQPIVSIRSKTLFALEALTRCTYNGQFIPPDLLFNLAKEKGLSQKLDILTRRKAINKFKEYYEKDNNLILFLNFESTLINNFVSINNNDFIENIIENGIPFKNFVLEIKEDEITNSEALEDFCKAYKNLGFSIALDDFGTGSSTFDRINLIRPDIIKVDKSLFDNIQNNQINKEIVKAISKMSHNLGIRVLAEGVEDEDSICTAMKSTINLFQGYYFLKPKLYIDESDTTNILSKIIEIGKLSKNRTLLGIANKRKAIDKYSFIADDINNKIQNIENSKNVMEEEFKKYDDIEAMYLIDSLSAKQINETIIIDDINEKFNPTKHGDEHFLKEYYYITLDSKHGIFLSQKYVSYASGNICKTFAKRFKIKKNEYILCMDIVIEGL